MMSSKSSSSMRSEAHSAITAMAVRCRIASLRSTSMMSITRQANDGGKGHEKIVKNHCAA